jgi:nucleotide-binding universal stress UspA family protein/amino acid transporter
MDSHYYRPRNVGWKRAAGLLYGDWGTSKAYVVGLAFAAAGYTCLPIILGVCALTAVVAYNYTVVCKHFPDGGGVYSAARSQSRLLAVTGALLLVANFTVTAAMSAWAAMHYFGVPPRTIPVATIGVIVAIGLVNYFGPKHSGTLAIAMAVPMVVMIIVIVAFSASHLTLAHLQFSTAPFQARWVEFTKVILALSGVEAIANLTGVMRLNQGATMEEPNISQTARKAIWPVAIEVVLGTSLVGWAMLSVSPELVATMRDRWEDMLRFLAEHYGTMALGPAFGTYFGMAVGVIVGILLISAVNTAISAMIGLFYMMSRDGEMPRPFSRLNAHGVPLSPLVIATLLPVLVVMFSHDLESLAGLYAIGVVGAITVNLGSCVANRELNLAWYERAVMAITFVVLLLVELTIAKTRGDALFFAVCVVGAGLALRAYAQKRAALRTAPASQAMAATVPPEMVSQVQPNLSGSQTVLVAARGLTSVLRFGLEEARLRQGALYVLYVKELAVAFTGPVGKSEPSRWQEDPQAREIMSTMLELGRQHQVSVVPVYTVSDNPAGTILDFAATLGADILMLGASHRRSLVSLLKGNVVNEVARHLPENIQLVIYG